MRRRVFLHFVDHEILHRMTMANIATVPTCERLMRIAIVASPEPPLFPISAHHEEPIVSQLLRGFLPMVRRDLLGIAGNGATPKSNLDARRQQFSQDRQLFANLFAASQDHLVDEFASSWVEKQGNTTRGITRWWGANAANPDSLLAMSLYSREPAGDKVLDAMINLPTSLEGRPLLADVVANAIRSRRLVNAPPESLRVNLGAHLTRQWATLYCDALNATVFRDFGSRVPDMSIFSPLSFPTISVRRLELLLSELGCLQSILRLPIPALAEVLDNQRVERYRLAHELFFEGASDQDLWSGRRQGILAVYNKKKARSSIWLGRSSSVRPRSFQDELQLDARDVVRHVKNLANTLDWFAEASRIGSQTNSEERVVDRSFHISNITGDINVAQDSATINSLRVNSDTLASRLLQATGSETSAAAFIEWLTTNADSLTGEVSPDAIAATIEKAELPVERKSLLKRIGENLAISASSSGVVVAVIEAISHLA